MGGPVPGAPSWGCSNRGLPALPRSQVCDDEWHHYALNLEFPTVTLYADGISFDPALIHDNGLIHPPRREPALMIGACWAGKSPCLNPELLHGGAHGRGAQWLVEEQGQLDLMTSSP